jgi:NH3-dependent NAD+ synthetase
MVHTLYYLILLIIILDFVFERWIDYLNTTKWSSKLPPEFEGIYDENTIKTWLKKFYRRFFSQQFKRSCLPDGPKVGTISLSPRGDWRMPSDATADLWLKELE